MPIFKCDECGCGENTALSRYWSAEKGRKLCSACDPALGKWHGRFVQKPFEQFPQTHVVKS